MLVKPGTFLALLVSGLLLAGCTTGGGGGGGGADGHNLNTDGGENDNGGGTMEPLPLSEVRFWGYQIQGLDQGGAVDALAESRYDMLVLEPTRTDWSSDAQEFDTPGMVERLKLTTAHDGVHRKLIIAYIDIGQAEDWRWYWTWSQEEDPLPEDPLPVDWPEYIISRDPDGWSGNYPVAYWDDLWQDIIIYGENRDGEPWDDYTSVIDEVLRAGFDGIYLDWVEAFEDEDVRAVAAEENPPLDPAEEMIWFIESMGEYAEQRNPDFIIIQQNAASLIEGRPDLLEAIDAIAQEGVWFDGPADTDWDDLAGYWSTDQDQVDEYIGFLDQYQAGGLPVFVCEYALDQDADEAYEKAEAKGYLPYVTRRSLEQLTDTPPPGYADDVENDNGDEPVTPDTGPASNNTRLAAVNDWAYVLQGEPALGLDPIAESTFDLVVIDYSEDGSEEGEFSEQDIATLQDGGNRIVLAYMSIGEAEIGRFYFDNAWIGPDPEQNPDGPFMLSDQAPDFMAPPNPLFPDNFKVRFWDPLWQEIIVSNPGGNPYIGDQDSYLDRIVDAGFDGVYLDIIDAYEYFGPEEINSDGIEERRDAAVLMIDLVAAIKEHAEAYGGREFMVFPQNGAGVIAEDAFPDDVVPAGETPASYAEQMAERYFANIDGIGAEDTFYFGDNDEDNPLDPQAYVIDLLDRYRAAGLLVLAIDYLTDPAAIDDFYNQARDHGWIPYSSTRDLSELTVNP